MKYVYPIIITFEEDETDIDYLVSLPDFESMTQARTVPEAIEMGQDLLASLAVAFEDNKKQFPEASSMSDLIEQNKNSMVTLVVADSMKYRKMTESRAVKKTLTIPSWLNSKAEDAGINFSQTLQEALKEKLG